MSPRGRSKAARYFFGGAINNDRGVVFPFRVSDKPLRHYLTISP